jgi:hypothetical protein
VADGDFRAVRERHRAGGEGGSGRGGVGHDATLRAVVRGAEEKSRKVARKVARANARRNPRMKD